MKRKNAASGKNRPRKGARRFGPAEKRGPKAVEACARRILKVLEEEEPHPWKIRTLLEAAEVRERSVGIAALERLKRDGLVDLDAYRTAALHTEAGANEADGTPRGCVRAKIVSLSEGFGFARPENGGDDLFIPGSALSGAFLGDTVLVGDVRREERGPAGRVRRVLERGPTEITGTVSVEGGRAFVYPDGAIRRPLRVERRDLLDARDGDKVLAQALQDRYGEWSAAKVEKRFGSGSKASVCADAVVARYGIPAAFPEDVLREAESVARPVSQKDLQGRLDLREEKIFTVDGADAKDLDDAVSVRRTRNGYVLGVHIADVSHYVRENTALDREAEKRGTSVYFADRVIPMLPKALSNGECSLNAGEDKLTLTARMRFDRGGNMVGYDFFKSVIRSKVRGVYSEVNAIFAGTADRKTRGKYLPVKTQLSAARELVAVLKRRAVERGRMDLESGELRFVLDGDGVCVGIEPRWSGEAEEMIEQLMVAANTAAARFALEKGLPFLYRIHEPPERGKLDSLTEALHLLNVPCAALEKGDPTPSDFAGILERVRGALTEAAVNQLVLRTMEKARYSDEEKGHYGLALEEYAHFTSPIRRYPDTAVHRMLSVFLKGTDASVMRRKYDAFVKRAARTASDAEIRAVSAERDAEDCYMAEYMAQHVGERFAGVVTGVTAKGVFVRVPNGAEGFVSLDRFPGEDFVFDGVISHRSEKRVLTVGTPLAVTVLSAYVASGKVDLAPVPESEP